MSGCVLVAALQCHPACVRACVRFHGRYPALAKNWLLDIRRSDNAFELLRPVALHLCALIRNAWLWLLPCDAPSRRAAVFRLFDVDGDGFVTRADLAKSMDLLVGTSISPQTRDEIIRRTIAEADADGDGRISFEDFSQVDASISSLFPLPPPSLLSVRRSISLHGSRLAHLRTLQTSLSTMEWQQFVVPIKSTSRWEAQESLNQSNSFTKLTEEPHGETH